MTYLLWMGSQDRRQCPKLIAGISKEPNHACFKNNHEIKRTYNCLVVE